MRANWDWATRANLNESEDDVQLARGLEKGNWFREVNDWWELYRRNFKFCSKRRKL